MANATNPIIPRDGVVVITDNTGTPKSWTLAYRGGDLKLTNWSESQKTQQTFMSCGTVYAGRKVDDQPIGVEFTADAVHIIGDGTTATFGDVILKRGAWASAVSTLPTASGDLYCLTFTFTVERSNFSGGSDNVVVLKYVYGMADFTEGVPSKWGFKGENMPLSDAVSVT
jgi:hypothetical protein